VPQTCTDGAWADGTACSGDTAVCLAGNCVACTPGSTKCDNNGEGEGSTYTCSTEGTWGGGSACTGGFSCNTENECGDCVNGDAKCENDSGTGSSSVCANGVWGTAVSCGDGIVCKADGETCGDCAENTKQCSESGVPQTCTDGAWADGTACSGDTAVCLAGNCVACTPGSTKCDNNGEGEGSTYTCSTEGTWGGGSACTDGFSCNTENECGECVNGAKKCIGSNQPQSCTNGAWSNEAACSALTPVCNSDDGNCVACTNDGHCSGETPVCNTETNECEAAPVSCEPGTKECVDETFRECNTEGNAWEPIECGTGEYASTPYCVATDDMCAACTKDEHCSAPTPACKVDTDNPSNNVCVECVTDDHCADNADGKTECGDANLCVESGGEPVINLFFSEYIEGSNYNKALEVYNAGTEAVDLETAACKILTYTDGKTTSTSLALTGTVAVKGVHVIIHADANEALKAAAGASPQVPGLTFNGNDAVVLECDDVVMDVIGQIGHSGVWSVGGVSTENMTLVRKCDIVTGDKAGDDVFDPSAEWVAYPQDTFDYLGNRESGCEDPAPACTTDADCTDAAATKCGTGDPKVCEALDVDWGQTLGYNADTLIMWGEVYYANHHANGEQVDNKPNADGAKAKIVCTEDITATPSTWVDSGEALITTKVFAGNNFEFSGMVSLSKEERHCVLAFSGDGGANWKYAKTGDAGGLVDDLTTLVAADAFAVAGVNVFGFDSCNFGGAAGYTDGTCTQDSLDLSFTKGMKAQSADISDSTLITSVDSSLKLNKAGDMTITAPNGVGKVSIAVRKVNVNSANVTLKAGTKEFVRTGMAQNTEEILEIVDVNESGAVEIKVTTTERIVVDSLTWTDHM
ncbi:MAG: hypothetical protein ACOX8U_03425, partial [Bradymonadia bacterium]